MKKDNFILLILFTTFIFIFSCKNENLDQKDEIEEVNEIFNKKSFNIEILCQKL